MTRCDNDHGNCTCTDSSTAKDIVAFQHKTTKNISFWPFLMNTLHSTTGSLVVLSSDWTFLLAHWTTNPGIQSTQALPKFIKRHQRVCCKFWEDQHNGAPHENLALFHTRIWHEQTFDSHRINSYRPVGWTRTTARNERVSQCFKLLWPVWPSNPSQHWSMKH